MGSSQPISSSGDADADTRLVEGLRRGEPKAFEQLVRDRGGPMLAVAKRIVRDDHEAADAVQDAFITAFRRIDQFDGRSKLSTWLHRVTVNAALMRLRKQRRLAERSVDDLLPQFDSAGHRNHAGKSGSEWPQTPDQAVADAEMHAMLHESIAQLPETHRDVLVLRDIQEMSTEQAAAALGIRPGAVKTRLHRARQALRELLEDRLTQREETQPRHHG